MSILTCPKCGRENPGGADRCQHCGADLSPRAMPPSPSRPATDPIANLWKRAKRFLRRAEKQYARPSQPSTRVLSPAESSATSPSMPSPTMSPEDVPEQLSAGTVLDGRYIITRVRALTHSTYYDALDLVCPTCQTNHDSAPPDGLCWQCRSPLTGVLIHGRVSVPGRPLSDAEKQRLLGLSTGHAGILHHLDILSYGKVIYTAVAHPGQWGVLVRGQRKRSSDEVLSLVIQTAQVVYYLHAHGFAYSAVGSAAMENLITVGGGTSVRLADLSPCVPLSSGNNTKMWAQINRDIAFLGNLLFFLSTGKELSRSGLEAAPPIFRPIIERAMRGEYASVQDMLTDFSLLPPLPAATRSLKPSHGQATHPGRRHTRNEDAIVTFTFDKEQDRRTVPIGFYVVADGMGGHAAGDVASRTVNQIVTDWVIKTKVLPDLREATRKLTSEDVPAQLLTQAIRQANQALFEHARNTGSDLGSTVTAALIIGDVATIANVGDSRTYLLRQGQLEQITQDHSLVARLVDARVIKPEEVRTHPQRNQIYRSLGHKPDVEVDTFAIQLRRGDRLILCSDGLWEMVLDEDIRRIVEQARTPQQACDTLVEAANRAGGEDNISVIVVEME